MAGVIDIYKAIDAFAPFSLQADYDNSGMKLGYQDTEVTGVLVTLDTTFGVIMEAQAKGCNVIVEHHPVIWTPLREIDPTYPPSKCLLNAARFDIAIISAHTNVDFADGGLNDYAARCAGLTDIKPLSDRTSARIGKLEKPLSLGEYARYLGRVFDEKNIKTVGNLSKIIKKAAIINGGGGSDTQALIDTRNASCDVFITSDVKHNVARLAKELNYAIIELSHHASEAGFMPLMSGVLKAAFPNINIFETTVLENPYN